MKINRANLLVLLLAFLLIFGCATSGGNVQKPVTISQEAIAFKAVSIAFDAYDLSMTTLRTLQTANLITLTQFEKVKKNISWPLYNSIVAADSTAQKYAAALPADKQNLYDQLTQALVAVAASQKELATVIKSLQGGK